MIGEGKRLRKLGLAVHWLKANSKAPLEAGWQKGKRKSWEELEDSYRYGFNLGVRLGKASEFKDGTFLAVVDCDVKSDDPKHVKEMEKRLRDLLKEAAPQVHSGRGNGSRHLYVRTTAPVAPFRYTQSPDKVRVHMPSAQKWTPHERSVLSAADIKEGWHLRPAWEISVMGEGQQVVLPPSIHPDTGGTYEWAKPLTSFKEMPIVDFGEDRKAVQRDQTTTQDFKISEVDLISSSLPDRTVDLILSGKDCTDRSAALFTACIAMFKAGFSDDQILTILTDRDTYLGACAYEHANTTSRKRAADWVRKYTLAKVKSETSAAAHFKDMVIVEDLTEEEAQAQREAVLAETHWEMKLERGGDQAGGRPKSTMQNIHLILTNSEAPNVIVRNDFLGTEHYSRDTQWGGRAGQAIRDIDLVRIKFWLAEKYRFEPGQNVILEAVQKIADANKFHPIRDYLKTVSWDGVPRLENWLADYLGATGPEEYLRAVGTKTLTAMIARVMEPGIKFDSVLVLEGKQGCGKSTAVKILAEPWFSDAMINIGDKDAVLAMRLAWVMELGELSSMRKTDIDQLKQFISQPTDQIRLPYGKLAESFPRQCIFIGTTNSSEYLRDTTGNRRFWPVRVEQCDFKALARDKDQLLAEARFAYEMGETLYLNSEVEAIAGIEQDDRVFVDEWVNQIQTFLDGSRDNFPKKSFTISDLFSDFGPLAQWKATKSEQMRAAECLRVLNYTKRRARTGKKFKVVWVSKT